MKQKSAALMQRAIRSFNEIRLILWVCRVSVISVVLGWLLFLLVPQARDLFIDLPAAKEGYRTWTEALLVAIALLVFWAVPVFYAARKALDDPHWLRLAGHGLKGRRSRLMRDLPSVLGALCFVAVLVGIWILQGDIYDAETIRGARQARSQLSAHIVATLVVGLFYAAILYRSEIYAKLRDLTHRNRGGEAPAVPSGEAEGKDRDEAAPVVAANAPEDETFGDAALIVPGVEPEGVDRGEIARIVPDNEPEGKNSGDAAPAIADGKPKGGVEPKDGGDVKAKVWKWARYVFVGSFVLVILAALWFFILPATRYGMDRAILLSFVLGAWVPTVGWLSRLSYRAELPLIVIALLLVVGISTWRGDGHEIRITRSNAVSEPRPGTQWYLDTAVEQWTRANDCELSVPQVEERAESVDGTMKVEKVVARHDKPCPSPVIVAAAGGASRAAFITGATLGTLLDATCRRQPAYGKLGCAERPIFANRLFAISSVSGGSLGAAAYAVAMAAAAEKEKAATAEKEKVAAAEKEESSRFVPPCSPDDVSVLRTYFRTTPPRTWRDCLESIVSGDFLSATAIGLVIRDPLPFLRSWTPSDADRAGLLEDAWTEWSHSRMGGAEPGYFARPFASFGPRQGDWRPLLILNGTSVLTGKRVLTSHLSPNHSTVHNQTEKHFRIFQDAYDIRELFEKPFLDEEPACDRFTAEEEKAASRVPFGGRDFTLATAVTNSARFPVISPVGTISCERVRTGALDRVWKWFLGTGREVVDHVVDGGYFENFGATTAMDLAHALEALGLKPVILVISNEPLVGKQAQLMLADACAPLPPSATNEPFLSMFFRPAGALYQTRDARGSYAVRNLSWSLRTPRARGIGCKASLESEVGPVFHVTLYQEAGAAGVAKSVSMSWWLSKVVQEFIDYQIPDKRDEVGPRKKSNVELFKGRMDNVRQMFGLCKAIGATKECERHFEGLPLTAEKQAQELSEIQRQIQGQPQR